MTDDATQPLVSVLVTSYNYAQFVGQCLDSVCAQTYPNVEIIVVDDGSSDNSAAVIDQKLESAPFKAELITQENKGQAEALNAAFAASSGTVIAPLDSDDYWHPKKLARMVEFVSALPDAGIYQHQLNTASGPKRATLISGDIFDVWKTWDGGVFNIADAFDGISFSPFVPTSGLVFRREVLERVMPIPAAIKSCADAFLTRTTTAYGPLASLPETLGTWRDHGGNAGHDDRNNFKNFWEPVVMPALNRFYADHSLGLELTYDPKRRSYAPVARMLGESSDLRGRDQTPRQILNRGLSPRLRFLAEFVRSFLREQDAEWLRSLVRGNGKNRA